MSETKRPKATILLGEGWDREQLEFALRHGALGEDPYAKLVNFGKVDNNTLSENDTCPACGYEADSGYRKGGVVAGCENDNCRVDGFTPWIGGEET